MGLTNQDREWVQKNFAQQSNIHELIKQAVISAIEPLKAEIAELKLQVAAKDKRIHDLETQLNESVNRNAALIHQRADDADQYSKKQNIRVSGITYIDPETEHNDDLQGRVLASLSEEGVDISRGDIFRLHYAGRPHPLNKLKKHMNFSKPTKYVIDPQDTTETAEVLIRFTNWRARSAVQKLKTQPDSNLRANLHITKFRQDQLERIRKTLLDENRRAYAFINNECKIVVSDCSESEARPKRTYIEGWLHFQEIRDKISVDPAYGQRQRDRLQRGRIPRQ